MGDGREESPPGDEIDRWCALGSRIPKGNPVISTIAQSCERRPLTGNVAGRRGIRLDTSLRTEVPEAGGATIRSLSSGTARFEAAGVPKFAIHPTEASA